MKPFTYLVSAVGWLTICFQVSAQTPVTPRLVPDGPVTKLEYSPGLGLIMAGNFHYVGYPAKNVAVVDNNTGDPAGRFPFLTVTNNVAEREVIPDGAGGWYVVTNSQLYSYGSFDRRPQQIWGDSTGRLRTFDCMTHLNADNSIDSVFRINANTSTYRLINIQRVVLYKSRLYAWCDLADQTGNFYRRQLLGINAQTGAIEWNPNTGHRIDVETGDLTVLGHQLFVVGRMNIVNGQPTTRYSLSYNLDTHQLTNWNPLGSTDLECGPCVVSSIKGMGNRLVMTATVDHRSTKEFIATDTVSNILWRQRPEGFSSGNPTIDNSVGYYLASSYGSEIIKIRLSDGQTVGRHRYSEYRQTSDTSKLFVGDAPSFSLQGKHLYIYGSTADGLTVRRSAVQVDTATFKPTDWKPFNERETGESDYAGNYRSIGTLAFQGARVFIAGDFSLIKIQFAPNIAAIDPITSTLRWRPRVNLQQENYLQQIQAIAADGDSLIWVYQPSIMKALDARTGFKVKSFDLINAYYGSTPFIKQIIPASDRLYLQGQFQHIRGIAVTNGFAAITKEGGVFPWEPLFTNGTGQVNKMALQGNQIYLGGQFTTYNGAKNLAIIDRFTGVQTNWKADMPNSSNGYAYEVKDFVVQGSELFTVGQDRGYNMPGEYRKISLSSSRVTATYSYTTCQASDQLLAKDRYIFVNERYCTPYERENLSYFDQGSKKFSNKSLLTKYNLFINGSSRDLIPNPNDLTFVGNKLYYSASYSGYDDGSTLPISPLMTLNFPKGFFAETVEYFPKSGGNASFVTVNFYGFNLGIGSRVKLTRAGQSSIIVADSLLNFPEPFRMQAVFDLKGKATGEWNIEITTPGNGNISVPNGFRVSPSKPVDIRLSMMTPAAIRSGMPAKVIISIANRGDTDVYGVPVIPIVDSETTLTAPSYTRTGINYNTKRFPVKQINGSNFNGNGHWLMLNKLSAGQIFELPITVQTPGNRPVEVKAISGNPYSDSEINPDDYNFPEHAKKVQKCLEPIAKLVPDLIQAAVGVAFPELEAGFLGSLGANLFKDNYLKPRIGATDVQGSLQNTFREKMTEAAVTEATGNEAIGEATSTGLGLLDDLKKIPEACAPLKPDPKTLTGSNPIPIVRASDPNDILGPVGISTQRYINPQEALSYLIRFENYANATADAQLVRVVDTLDRNKFDYSTFQLGFFNVADTTFYVPPGRKQYAVDWDLRPKKNLVLRMEARFNDTTGILTSTYTALDPITMELTQDVLAGFLPPNRTAPEGEGSLAFSIRVKEDLPNLTPVKNTAHIYFDYNAAVPTPAWTNTIDKGLPQSSMKPLASTSTSTTLTLGWHGTDSESGPKLYDVFVSVNGTGYKPLLSATSDTTFQFVGKADSTYRFYSIAYDGVYNQEPVPLTFDAETTIRLKKSPDLTPLVYMRPISTYGTSDVTLVVDVVELEGVATNGQITVKITRDRKVSLTLPASATSVNNRSVQNSVWTFKDTDSNYYELTTSQSISPGDKLSLGLKGQLAPGATTGLITISAVVLGSKIGEERTGNNVDSDKVEYYPQ